MQTLSITGSRSVICSAAAALRIHLAEDILHVIQRPNIDTHTPEQTVPRAQVKMEIRNRIHSHIVLTVELEIAHSSLKDDLSGLCSVHRFLVQCFKDLDRTIDAGLQLLECRLVILEDHVLGTTDTVSQELGCVAAALDLVREAGVY